MKHLNFFKRALLALLILCSSSVWAYDFDVDGIYYNITDETSRTVAVTSGENKYTGSVVIPSAVTYNSVAYSVTSIGDDAFALCKNLTNVTIGNSVKSIRDHAFHSCDGLTNVTIPNSVIGIGVFAFYNCRSLKSITIPNSVTSIGDYAFSGCDGLTAVHISDLSAWCNIYFGGNYSNPLYYAHNLYLNGEKVTNLVIPDDVTAIKNYAFYDCDGLTSIEIPNSVTEIGSYAFHNCDGLTAVHISDLSAWCNIYFGGNYCNPLYYAHNLYLNGEKVTNLVIPDDVTAIEYYAFYGCTGLTSVTIPNSVISIRGSAFESCTGLTSVTIGNSVTSIGGSAFESCSALASVTIGNSVTSIGGSAFESCTGLTEITIPSSVTRIGEEAFAYSRWLTDIYFASNPTIGDDAIPSTATCHLTLTDSDAADFNTANSNTYADVSYTRTISEGKYGTIILPFAPDEASLQNYAFYTPKEAGDGYVKFEEVAAPEANTPYLYTLREGMWNVAITGGETTIAADINNCNVDGWEFVGSFTNQTIDCTGGNYYALSPAENKISRITKTLTVLPYRAYFKSTVAQNSNLRVFIGGTTGVTEISPDDIEGFNGGAVYDLYGRPVSEPTKGDIYIINGKKVVW